MKHSVGIAIAALLFMQSTASGELDAGTIERVFTIRSPDVETADVVVPIVVTVVDSKGSPIEGAAVGLMRLGDGGYTEKDVLIATNPRTTVSGTALIDYPGTATGSSLYDLGAGPVQLIGAITVVHEGFRSRTVELASLYPNPLPAGERPFAPWVRVELKSSSEKPQAEQGVAPQSATRSESDSEGGHKPQSESEARTR